MAERRVLDYFQKLAAPDGTLATDQLVAAFSSLGLGKLSPDELELGIAKSGLSNGGRIHIDTFIRWLWREDSMDDDPGSPLSQANKGLPLILISDPGQDLDDEMTYIMLRYLVHRRIADVRGIIATLSPAFDRARLCRGTLDTLGLYSVPIGVGTDGGDTAGVHKAATFETWAHTYMPTMHSRSSSSFEPGNRLLCRLYEEAEPKSLTLVIIASLKDAAVFLRDNEALFVEKTSEVVIMGGVKPFEHSQHWAIRLEPDTAHNNEFDSAASSFFYRRCQEVGVRLVIVSRFAAYAAKVPRSCYDDLAAMGSSVGCRLRNAQRASIQALWSRACADGAARQGLPARCDQQWFLKTFCGGARETNRSGSDTIWDIVDSFMQYDTIALLTAFPQIRSEYFAPIEVNGLGGVKHLVIGCSEDCPSVSKPIELAQLLNTGFSKGLALGHRQKLQFIFILSPRWNNRADELVSLLFLRALYELGIVDCAGIIISPARNTTRPNQDFHQAAEEIRATLAEVGMAHVPVHVAAAYSEDDDIDPHILVREKSVDFDSKFMTGARLLSDLYDQAPPAGVTLVVESSLGDVAKFVHDHPKKFHQRTQAVVLVGGALVEAEADTINGSLSSTGPTLVPDPTAQNNSLDMPAAESFFKAAQHHLVPLIVLSRYYAQAVNVPRKLFDALASHGGKIGTKVCAAQRRSMEALWSAVRADPSDKHLRRQLPERCDRNWFIKTFCPNGPPQDDDDIWSAIGHFNLYSPLALMAVIPSITNHVTKGTEVVVRSVRHTLIGVNPVSTGLLEEDSARLKSILYQCLFTGARLNLSEFDLSLPPAIPLGSASAGEDTEWKYNPNHNALDWLLNDRRWSRNNNSSG